MLDAMKAKLTGALSKFSGQKDFLEGVCASAALIAAADGEIKDAELAQTLAIVKNHPTLSKSFKEAEIGKCMDAMLARAKQGRTGRMTLYNEIREIKVNPEKAEVAYLCALDIAESDGGIGAEERVVLNQVAKELGISPSKYENV